MQQRRTAAAAVEGKCAHITASCSSKPTAGLAAALVAAAAAAVMLAVMAAGDG
jgi:hypothetical protein